MEISQKTKDDFKHVLTSILIGAGVAFVSKFFELLFNYLNGWLLDYTGTIASMIYYLKSSFNRKIV